MSNFHHHESCPSCGSRDNLGVWSDGHKFCFGCRYYVPSPDTLENIKNKIEPMENNNNESYIDSSSFSYSIPAIALTWLRKYGISDKEINYYGLCWNTRTDSLVFPIFDLSKKLLYYQERYFGPKKDISKYITRGSKTQKLGFISNEYRFKRTIVLVEDFISCIKVARIVSSSPLLGSTIDGNALRWIIEHFNRVRVWLDMDKASEALKEASRLVPAISDVRCILTSLDPKEYTSQEIVKILETVGLNSKGK